MKMYTDTQGSRQDQEAIIHNTGSCFKEKSYLLYIQIHAVEGVHYGDCDAQYKYVSDTQVSVSNMYKYTNQYLDLNTIGRVTCQTMIVFPFMYFTMELLQYTDMLPIHVVCIIYDIQT